MQDKGGNWSRADGSCNCCLWSTMIYTAIFLNHDLVINLQFLIRAKFVLLALDNFDFLKYMVRKGCRQCAFTCIVFITQYIVNAALSQTITILSVVVVDCL